MLGQASVSRSAVLLLLLTLSSCRDEAAEAFARAELQQRALIDEGVPPQDPRFDTVLKELDKVPPGSKHAKAAEKLRRAILAGRTHGVRTPLALGPNGRRPEQLEALLAACARLATLAAADGGVERRTLEALEKCRREAEQLELRFSHPEEYGDGGEPHDE